MTSQNDNQERALSALRNAELKLNRNDTRLITELLRDLSKRDGGSPADIIASARVQEILADKKRNAPQRLERLKKLLADERYPVYTRAETVFWAMIKELKLHPNIKINHCVHFEEDSLEVRFSYDNDLELRRIGASLERLAACNPVKHALDSAENSC